MKRLDILNNTDQLTNSELLMVRNEQKGLQRNQTEVKSMNNIMETEITDLVQQQNILKDTLANITAHLNTTVLDPINISDLRVLQSQFRYLSLSLNDLHINVSDNHRKTEAALSGIRSSLKHINGSEINLANNTAVIATLQTKIKTCSNALTALQQSQTYLDQSVTWLNQTVQQNLVTSGPTQQNSGK